MAKKKDINSIDRKGKPSGNGRESEGLNNPFAGVSPEVEEQLAEEYIDEVTGKPAANVDIKHANRHLHKGEEIKTYKDKEE